MLSFPKVHTRRFIIPTLLVFLLYLLHTILSISSFQYKTTLNSFLSRSVSAETYYKSKRVSSNFIPPNFLSHPTSSSTTATNISSGSSTSRSNQQRTNSVILIRCLSSDLYSILSSIQSLEDRFNHAYNYPYVFLSNTPFSSQFKSHTTLLCSGSTSYGLIPSTQWPSGDDLPSNIDREKVKEGMNRMREEGIPHGDNLEYRKMCRYQSGFFFRHPLLESYEYYWRVEPNVKFYCNLNYDPFLYMQENQKKYGFVITMKEYEATIPSLWKVTKEFISKNPELISKPNSLDFISNDNGLNYNGCHFWSNFEIASLSLWRSEAYLKYFDHLERSGGFFEERWGDAPVHSIAASLFLKPSEIHFFQDIGYRHEPILQCPQDSILNCYCNPKESFENHEASCTNDWKKIRIWGG